MIFLYLFFALFFVLVMVGAGRYETLRADRKLEVSITERLKAQDLRQQATAAIEAARASTER